MQAKDAIKQYRERKHATQADVGLAVGVTASAVGQWEQGRTTPGRLIARRLDDYLEAGGAILVSLGFTGTPVLADVLRRWRSDGQISLAHALAILAEEGISEEELTWYREWEAGVKVPVYRRTAEIIESLLQLDDNSLTRALGFPDAVDYEETEEELIHVFEEFEPETEAVVRRILGRPHMAAQHEAAHHLALAADTGPTQDVDDKPAKPKRPKPRVEESGP